MARLSSSKSPARGSSRSSARCFLNEQNLSDSIASFCTSNNRSQSGRQESVKRRSSTDLREDFSNHARRIVLQAFNYEFKVVHRELLQHAKSTKCSNDEVQSSTAKYLELCSRVRNFDIELYKDNLPRGVADQLKNWSFLNSKVVHVMESSDYVTTKLLIELESGNQVEAVILRHKKRTTLCVSSQVGCKMACTFCATGTLGQRENLSSGEIQQQLIHANRYLKTASEPRDISNVVFMGMGEPLNNYAAVVSACQAMIDPCRFSLSPGKITISTVGVIPRMKTLPHDLPGVSLALSLHAPNQKLRKEIIPTAGAYPLDKLMSAVKGYLDLRERKYPNKPIFIMIEYILLSGINDTGEIAKELAELLSPISNKVKVNLIPYNPIFNPEGLAKTYIPPTEEDMETFKNILQKQNGIFCTIRTEMGQDVNGACGQLACISEQSKSGGVDIEDLYNAREKNSLYDAVTGENVNRTDSVKSRRYKERIEALKIETLVKPDNASTSVKHVKRSRMIVVASLFIAFGAWTTNRWI